MQANAIHAATKKGVIYVPKAEQVLRGGFAFEKCLGEGLMGAAHADGKRIIKADAEGADKERMKAIIEEAFGKRLVDGYFGNGDIIGIFHYPDYEGLAVMKQIAGIPYLDKFVVAKEHQGNGLGKAMMAEIVDYYYKLVWRATPQNQINKAYRQVAQWTARVNGWNVYWINLEPQEILPSVIAVALLERTLI